MFKAEDTTRANYRSLFEYASGVEARLAQDRRLDYYHKVLPELLLRVKGIPLMYTTYSKGWNPDSNRDAFIVKRRVPDLSKPIYIEDEEGNKVQKGYDTQDFVIEDDEDANDFMIRKGRFKGQHGFNKGFGYLAPVYHVERDEMPFIQVDLDIDRADFKKPAWNKLLRAVIKVYDWFRSEGFDPLINFTGSSFHIWAKDGKVRSYAEIKEILMKLGKDTKLPLAAGSSHIANQITIDYPQNKYRAPMRFPLSIHGDTGLASIIIPRNQLLQFDPLKNAHPDQVLKQLPNHLAKIDAWFADLPTSKSSAEAIITSHLATLNEADQERCMWGDCGVLADELMLRLQAAGYTDAVYELGLAYIHPFEEYDDKTFIGGHVVVTVDGVSYDVLGAGAKQRWIDGPVVQEMLSSHGFIDLGPLLSSHLTVNWVTSPWNEEHKTRSHNFAGKLVDFESEEVSSKKWYSSGNVHSWQQFLDTETLGPDLFGERDNYPYEDMKALESKYGLTDISAVIWVSAMPEVAASYMISQGLRDNSDEEVEEDWGFSKSDLETTKFGQIYYPPHVEDVDEYQGTVIPETDDGDGGYLLALNRDYTGKHPWIGKSAETKKSEPLTEFVENGKTWRLKSPGEWIWVELEEARETFTTAFAEWSEKFQAGTLPLVAGGWGIYHNLNQDEPSFKVDTKRMISDALDIDDESNEWSRYYGEWIYESISQNTTKNDMQEFWNQYWQGYFAQDEEVQRQVDEVNRHYVENALRYVETLLRGAGYAQGKLKLYRGIDLFNPEDFDPTGVGQSWTPVRAAATSYFGHMKIRSRKLGIIYDNVDELEFKSYVLTALVPVDSIDWYTTVLRALVFGEGDEKEIVLKRGAPIELINLPMELSFAIDGTPDALIRAAEDEDWWFTMQTPVGPDEEFGPYDSHEDAMMGIERVMQKIISLQDSHTREFPIPYQGRRGDGFGLRAEEDDNGRRLFEHKYQKILAVYESQNLPITESAWFQDIQNMIEFGDEYPEIAQEEEWIARSISDDMLNRFYAMLFPNPDEPAQYQDGKLLLYREIDMEDSADLNMAKAGIFWTPVLSAAKAHWGIAGDSFILRALVDFEDIVWDSSWYANLIMPEECEIRLKQGAEIELLPLTNAKRYYGGKYMLGAYVYPEEIVFEIDAPNPNILAVERGTETELLEAMKDLPEEYRRLMGISEVEPQPTQTGFASEDIDLTVGEAFDKALAEIRADVEAVQPRSKDLSEVTLEDYEKTKQVYQRFMIPAGITGSIVKDEWYYETESIYLWSDMFTIPWQVLEEEWKLKIEAQRSEKETDILASNEINYAYYWFMILQINSIYSMLLSRLVQKFGNVPGGVYAGPPVELPEIIESQRDSTDIKIYRWLATSQGDEPVRRLRNRMRPVDLNYYGGYSLDYLDGFGGAESVQEMIRKGLKSLSYGPSWSLSPDAYTRADQWRLAQEDVIHKENEKVGISLKRKLMDEEIDTRTYVIEKSLPASDVDWYYTLISSALWLDSPEYEVIPKRGVFLSEEITDKSDFEQEFNKVAAVVTDLFKEFSWWSDNQKELYDVSDLHDDVAGRARLREVESHLARLTRPGSLLWSSGDDSAYDAYPDDLRNPTYVFEDSSIFVDEDGETDGYTDEERGETYEEGDYFTRPFEESPDLDIRLRYAYTINRLSQLAEQYLGRLESLRTTLKPQFASGEVTLYRAFSLPEGEVPQLRRMTVFPLSMRIGDARRMENREQRLKYNYESYGAHWSLLPGFEWSDDFPSHYGKPYIMEKQIPYTDVDWFTTLLVMAYGREPEWEVAVNENVFLAENEVKIPLYHVTPLDQVGSILTAGLEPRIGPRSEGMELEPRVYLFGIKESMQDSFIWEEMLDEKYADEWRSGYAVLRIDLPIDWFQDRRVEKTFHPDSPEPSWEWSTLETIPGEYLKVEEEWEWNEDDITRYFQADFGMPAEDMKLETVSESWSKAVKQWKEIVDWAQQHGISAHREDVFVITPEEFEQALEIYNKILAVGGEVDYVGGFRDMDKDAKYLIPEITTDSEVAEIFRRQLDSIWDGFVDGIYMESMNHYVYYWILDWIKKLNTGLSAGVWRGQELNNIIHTQGRRTAIKAYRWITLPKGQLPTRNPQPLTYGQHWSLHPNAFKETDDWFGMSYGQQEYLIEKEVPVEDIDWFRTLISCLFFKDAEFEIIMNPMTYIAETIDEPHLYLETEYSEEELSETVGEAWDKAVTDWNLLAEWALYELDQVEKGREIKQVTKKDYQQALDIYKIIDKYSGFMFRDIGMWPEELPGLIPSITDDLESRKLLERQSLDLFDIEGKMNYYFYYALLSWVRGMNWGITGEPGSPIGDYKLNEIILSQFRSPTVKAYRWISTKKDVQPFRRLSRHKYVLSYGDHWSLHPDAYKLTGEWEGVVSSQDYLIEKEVPVEDIDWFATLISCLSWYYNPEFEIIMKPTTYIAETINEPHLYLDMDGCFADFGMPVYGKYLRDARNQAELDLATISDDYQYFHLSWDRFVINKDGETFTFTPRVPTYPYGWESGSIEDDFTPRVSLSSSIMGCLDALPDDSDGTWYVYGTKQSKDIISVQDYFEACPKGYGRDFNLRNWINSLPQGDQKIIKDYSEHLDMELSGTGTWGVNVSDLPPKYRDLFYACVPDALQHDEYWSLEPITMDYLGYLTWDTISHWYEVGGPGYPAKIMRNAMRNPDYWLSESVDSNQAISYPIRLYHGTSVRNWRAIQSSGELRTGCLASSHGYDIEMPETYIDLAIGEIEDNHPDIKAGGLVLEITFPDQATADQYLQADTTMYDLGMAFLEDDLYHRYAPADWQPADAEEGWHYGPMNWFITDFQDLVKSNQATKTIPYSPQDPADWQASYLSVYSVCLKQPIPLKYITVDWGSESRRAEEETSETVGEAWDKALVEWYEIVDWAKQEQETGIRDVSTTEFQQAIEVYNKLQRVAHKIGEPYFLGGSSDGLLWDLIQTYASDDLELEKILIEHYEEMDIHTNPYLFQSKTMNYFFYYGLIEWIIMMTWRLTSLNSYGGKELDDAISSQFQDSTLKAYRWISVHNDEFPSRNMNWKNYADFSYGAHWSLHPEVYTWTIEWEEAQYQKDYLIEKDVPVEDIDWFETLISCLFFLDSPELEIIMKPMTFIAETINEPHLYLDMDGCFADFAGAITQRVNEVLQVQDVSSIPSKSLRRAARKAKILGITSVSESDFDLSLSHDPVRKKVIDRMLYKIASESGFFYNLEVMNRDILEEIVASGRPFSFLSAPIGGTNDYSIEDKRAWVRDRLGLDVTVKVVPREEKVTFCRPGDVLIDDHETTIAEWTAAGGQGVLFPQEIESFLRNTYNGETTTNVAEEVNNVNQYPIMYKKTAIGTLQQWQVLLLPQESGGYLLTTASGKVDGAITQGRGKLITEGKVNRTALEQAELEADSKFKKKKDEGYFATKEEAMNNLVVLPMLAHNFEKRSHDISYPAVAQRKFDGVRCLAITQADGSIRLMTRKGKDFTHLNHLRKQIEALNIEPNMVLDGEVYSDSLTFQEATGLVRRQTLKPGDIEKMEQIDYRLYDAILLDAPEATFLDRYSKLAALFPTSSSVEGRRMGNLVLTENFPLRGPEDIMSLHSQFTGDEEFEGVMIRNLHGTYDLNERSKHLQKFKTFQDAEYKIVGFNEAGGNWQGTPIWICEMEDGRQFNVTPVGDRPSRIEMFKNVDDYIGKMLTVKFFELTDDGIPRFGNGIAIRDYE
jgi:hypothetical protein